jgi:hypothetical protein
MCNRNGIIVPYTFIQYFQVDSSESKLRLYIKLHKCSETSGKVCVIKKTKLVVDTMISSVL